MKSVEQKGFTLIEVLVAVGIFGLLLSLAYATMGQTFANADYLTQSIDRLKAIQRAVRLIDSDIMQLSPRPIRDPLTDSDSAALRSDIGLDFALELTHTGWNNPAGLPRSNQQRSAYRLEEDELVRYHWNVLDRTLANEPVRVVLLDGVESLAFLYQQSNGEWTSTWPARDAVGNVRNGTARPRAVEMTLTLTVEGEIRRLLEVSP